MRILEANEIDQVSGAGLLGLNLNLGAGLLGILGIHADADVEVGGSNCGRSDGRGDHGRSDCGRGSRRHYC